LIHDEVVEFFSIYLIIPAALWFWGSHNLYWKYAPGISLRDKALPARKADKFTAMSEPTVWKMWNPGRLITV
jgi:hypothetical protein